MVWRYGMVVWYGTIPYHCEYGTVHDEGGWHEPGVQRLQTITSLWIYYGAECTGSLMPG